MFPSPQDFALENVTKRWRDNEVRSMVKAVAASSSSVLARLFLLGSLSQALHFLWALFSIISTDSVHYLIVSVLDIYLGKLIYMGYLNELSYLLASGGIWPLESQLENGGNSEFRILILMVSHEVIWGWLLFNRNSLFLSGWPTLHISLSLSPSMF